MCLCQDSARILLWVPWTRAERPASMLPSTHILPPDSKMHKSPAGFAFPGHHGINPRSCTTCSRRKIRCNKREPCSNCSKANVDCYFPPPGRAPRKPQKQTEGNLHERLRRLERVIHTLSNSRSGASPRTVNSGTAGAAESGAALQDAKEYRDKPADVDHIADRFGSLIVTEDASRYISPGIWTHLNDEVTIPQIVYAH